MDDVTQLILDRIDQLDAKNDARHAETVGALKSLDDRVRVQNGRVGRLETWRVSKEAAASAVRDRTSWRFPAAVAIVVGIVISVVGTTIALVLQ